MYHVSINEYAVIVDPALQVTRVSGRDRVTFRTVLRALASSMLGESGRACISLRPHEHLLYFAAFTSSDVPQRTTTERS